MPDLNFEFAWVDTGTKGITTQIACQRGKQDVFTSRPSSRFLPLRVFQSILKFLFWKTIVVTTARCICKMVEVVTCNTIVTRGFCLVTKPKLGLSLGTKVKILLHHSHRFSLRSSEGWILMFLAFSFLLIRPRDLHYTDTSLLSKRRLISRVHTQNFCAWTYPFVVLKLAEDIKLRRK